MQELHSLRHSALMSHHAFMRCCTAPKLHRWFVGSALAGSALLGGLAFASGAVSAGVPGHEFPLWGSDPAMPLLKVETSQPDLLQVGPSNHAYWIADGVWGAKGMTRGTFTTTNGTTYETAYSASKTVGTNGEIGWRSAWKFPDTPAPCGPKSDCYQDIKSYPAAVFGAKPGWANPAGMPGGFKVRLWPGAEYSYGGTKTPGSFLPMKADGALPPILSTFSYRHLVSPESGKGQLTYDMWLQNTAAQCHGFNNCGEITHEIMIPLTYWGGYGKCGSRNVDWEVKNSRGAHKVVTLDGRDWCLYRARHMGGSWDPVSQARTGGWTLVVFEPMKPLPPDTVHRVNLSAFINYLTREADAQGPWASGTEHLVSVEFGAEVQLGVGDIAITNFRISKP